MRFNPAPLLLAAALALVPAPRLAAQSDSTVGAFEVNLADDTPAGVARTITTEPMEGGNLHGLRWICLYGQTSVAIDFGHYLGGNDGARVNVLYHFDGANVGESKYWEMTGDHRTAVRRGRDAERMTAAAKQSRTVTVIATDPLDGETLQGVFSLEGFAEALQKITPCPTTP
jgi:hypothetical protein